MYLSKLSWCFFFFFMLAAFWLIFNPSTITFFSVGASSVSVLLDSSVFPKPWWFHMTIMYFRQTICLFLFRVDHERIKAVGPDRAAAEWLLRCGAKVRFEGFDRWHHDYNGLPTGPLGRYKIQAIDATESCIMQRGFDYLGQCKECSFVFLWLIHHLFQFPSKKYLWFTFFFTLFKTTKGNTAVDFSQHNTYAYFKLPFFS